MNIYTLNGQVLTNDGKWLKEKEAPPETYYLFEGWDPNGTSDYANNSSTSAITINCTDA